MKIYCNRNINESNNSPVTTNLADFCARERHELIELLTAWENSGLPDDFYEDDVVPAFNRNSGEVFLTNSDYQVVMVVDGKLESWYCTPYEGHEGFYEDLFEECKESVESSNSDPWEYEDMEYLKDIAESRDYTDDVIAIEQWMQL